MKYTSLLLLLLFGVALAQLPPEDMQKIDEFMEDLLECREMPGAALSAVLNGEIVINKGYGFSNLERAELVTEDTIFSIASCSKTFTSTLMSKLFSETSYQLNWDTVVSSVVDGEVYFYNGYVTNHTKFRDCLSQQTGLPNYNAPWMFNTYEDRADVVYNMRYVQPQEELRDEFIYNNYPFTVAMHPLEIVFGQSWEDLLRTRLLEPLDMGRTTFYDQASPEFEGFATPYVWDTVNDNPDELVPLPFETYLGVKSAAPAASVCSTASDMAKWMQFILNGGVLPDGTPLMNASDLTRLWYPEAAYEETSYAANLSKPYFPVTDSVANYGLAYWNGEYRGYKMKVVSGDLTGFHSDVFFLPDMNIGIFFATNFGGHFLDRRFVHMYVADVLLGLEPAFNSTTACEMLNDFVNPLSENDQLQNSMEYVEDIFKSIGIDERVFNWMKYETKQGKAIGLPKHIAHMLAEFKEELLQTSEYSTRNRVENYTGIYGEFYHGNLTISENPECEGCLFLDYGTAHYTLIPTNETNVFWGSNNQILLETTPVIFSTIDEDGKYKYASPVEWNLNQPVIFERGLRMDEAPGIDIGSCN